MTVFVHVVRSKRYDVELARLEEFELCVVIRNDSASDLICLILSFVLAVGVSVPVFVLLEYYLLILLEGYQLVRSV